MFCILHFAPCLRARQEQQDGSEGNGVGIRNWLLGKASMGFWSGSIGTKAAAL
jgi:hypothetical protein